MKIAITGHRPNKLGNDYDLTSPLIEWIRRNIFGVLTEYGDIKYKINPYDPLDISKQQIHGLTLITGMALGIDILFAKIAIEYSIPFIAAIPCKNQWNRWPYKSVKVYEEILQHSLCTIHNVSNQNYTDSCMQKRNEWMVDNCDLLIAVWDGTTGGTANCINYAKSVNKEIIYINPKEL